MKDTMTCFYHPKSDAVSTCSKCGQAICSECNYVTGTHPICRNCWEKHTTTHKVDMSSRSARDNKQGKRVTSKNSEEPAAEGAKLEADLQSATSHAKPRKDVTLQQNTSGQGKEAIIPSEIEGWCWGAFLLTWIWGIGNRVWISLIVFIPIPFLCLQK